MQYKMDVNRKVSVDLSRLMIKLEEVLNATTRTKNTLSTSFGSVKKLLDGWHVPDTYMNDDPLECTCEVENEDPVSDVAKNIEEIVGKAQKLREQWTPSSPIHPKRSPVAQSANKQKISSKSTLKYPARLPVNNNTVMKKVNDIISKKIEIGSSNKQILKNDIVTDNVDSKKTESKLPVSKQSPLSAKLLQRTSCNSIKTSSTSIANGNSKKQVLRPQSKSSSSSLRTTYQKDFVHQSLRKSFKYKGTPSITSKECSVKNDNLESLKKSVSSNLKDTQPENKKTPFVSSSGNLGIAELEELLNQVTIYPNLAVNLNNEKIKESQIKISLCMVHGGKTVQSSKKNFRLVGLVEAIDVLGVPPDLVKVLKTYHSFLSAKSSYITSKGQSSVNSFANKLSELNDSRLKSMTYEPLVGLFLEYVALVADLSIQGNCKSLENKRINVAHFKEKSEELEIKFRKWSNVDESVFSTLKFSNIRKEHKTNCLQASLESLDLDGMWDVNSRKRAQVLEKMRCIRYNNKAEWKKFDANMQNIQKLEFQLEMFDIIEKTVFPQMSIYSPQDSIFVALFKTACTLCNMTLLRPPLIIKSN